ncbi:hydroxymethylglutaryl-CoA lyase [Rhizobium sp. SSA_523]|uniref:hydroxymethylglutaryl-CoA lyase n=1 Tax=Rhizobium sp. SSA_523 TaxID=2952477 RepID=UPI0020900F16|nr:hydroxymethylglutaryl-CoA lyase [Rhizobium sp. SSA_523]MCO5732422.1 hydroxymethylglutaryl-CoA lyase [Rhizobium sp. SSA_523]WKC22435.1 hydroxymethylglutaryl-CoA lyase [Rhizobium sp. SSA_523]
MREFVELYEVGPRDGLQNESRFVATEEKLALIRQLAACGFSRIEATSFVSPKWVPQMADAAEVMAGVPRRSGLSYCVLTPNLKGYEAAKAAGADEVAIFVSATEGFSRANLNASIAESLDRVAPVAQAALTDGLRLRGYVSVVTDCPFEGKVAPAQVAKVARELLALGCHEISLGETLGRGTPDAVFAMLSAVLEQVPARRLAGHFHDTGGLALANIDVALKAGLRVFDASVGGLGGCPYAPGAAGNVATELVARHLLRSGFDTGLDLDALDKVAAFARTLRSPA